MPAVSEPVRAERSAAREEFTKLTGSLAEVVLDEVPDDTPENAVDETPLAAADRMSAQVIDLAARHGYAVPASHK